MLFYVASVIKVSQKKNSIPTLELVLYLYQNLVK